MNIPPTRIVLTTLKSHWLHSTNTMRRTHRGFHHARQPPKLNAIALIGVVWFVVGWLINPANHRVGPPSSAYDVQSLRIPSESGSELAAWYLPCKEAVATVILLHPIRGDRRVMLGRAELFRRAGYATLLIDFQAHGESSGKHITAGFCERHDVVATVRLVRARNPNHRIGVVGWSLGGAAALLLHR